MKACSSDFEKRFGEQYLSNSDQKNDDDRNEDSVNLDIEKSIKKLKKSAEFLRTKPLSEISKIRDLLNDVEKDKKIFDEQLEKIKQEVCEQNCD